MVHECDAKFCILSCYILCTVLARTFSGRPSFSFDTFLFGMYSFETMGVSRSTIRYLLENFHFNPFWPWCKCSFIKILSPVIVHHQFHSNTFCMIWLPGFKGSIILICWIFSANKNLPITWMAESIIFKDCIVNIKINRHGYFFLNKKNNVAYFIWFTMFPR